MEDLNFRYLVNKFYVAGYATSLLALVISLAIFLCFRSLHSTRIWIHVHLFTAIALNNVFWIIWYETIVNSASVVEENEVWCQVLHLITMYNMVSSYFWLVCEAVQFHMALVVVFIKREMMALFVAIGWGLPLLVVSVYAAVQYQWGSTDRCWTDYSDTSWIVNVPIIISLIASFGSLFNVVRVLCKNLRTPINDISTKRTKKAVKTTLMLIPLFGLHYIIIPLRPSPESIGEKTYQVISALLTSLQGLFVCMLFCFFNKEVCTVITAYKAKRLRTKEAIAMTGITVGESMINTRENIV